MTDEDLIVAELDEAFNAAKAAGADDFDAISAAIDAAGKKLYCVAHPEGCPDNKEHWEH